MTHRQGVGRRTRPPLALHGIRYLVPPGVTQRREGGGVCMKDAEKLRNLSLGDSRTVESTNDGLDGGHKFVIDRIK